MNYADRRDVYLKIEAERQTKVIAFVTGERGGLQTQIAPDAVAPFVSVLDAIGPTAKISLILDTNGGHTSAAWRLINLIRSFCDDLEVIIPSKAMSAGTLMSLGADRIVMTKQAALGPIDPSIENHPMAPTSPRGQTIPVSAEAIRGYIDEIKKDVTDSEALAKVWIHLSSLVHPLLLGQVFRAGEQIRHMAKALIGRQVPDEETQKKIIQLLCSDSGSHDYTINRRAATEIGLNIEKPSAALYDLLSEITKSFSGELKTLEPYAPASILNGQPHANYTLVRGLIEGTDAGCYGFVSEGEFTAVLPNAANPAAGAGISDKRVFEGWRKLP